MSMEDGRKYCVFINVDWHKYFTLLQAKKCKFEKKSVVTETKLTISMSSHLFQFHSKHKSKKLVLMNIFAYW